MLRVRPRPEIGSAAESPASAGSLLAEVVPPTVAVAELRRDPTGVRLFPEEDEIIEGAAPSRRREFSSGRECARRALGMLGVPAAGIPRKADGAPDWPAGIVGSITHCKDYRAAAVGWRSDLLCVGIDAEPNRPLPFEVLPLISSEKERRDLRDLAVGAPDVCWDRLLFSAKESVYKAFSGAGGRWLDFTDAVVTFTPAGNSFEARVQPEASRLHHELPTHYAGQWAERCGLLVTATAIPSRA